MFPKHVPISLFSNMLLGHAVGVTIGVVLAVVVFQQVSMPHLFLLCICSQFLDDDQCRFSKRQHLVCFRTLHILDSTSFILAVRMVGNEAVAPDVGLGHQYFENIFWWRSTGCLLLFINQ